jgi:hypothetical protein
VISASISLHTRRGDLEIAGELLPVPPSTSPLRWVSVTANRESSVRKRASEIKKSTAGIYRIFTSR